MQPASQLHYRSHVLSTRSVTFCFLLSSSSSSSSLNVKCSLAATLTHDDKQTITTANRYLAFTKPTSDWDRERNEQIRPHNDGLTCTIEITLQKKLMNTSLQKLQHLLNSLSRCYNNKNNTTNNKQRRMHCQQTNWYEDADDKHFLITITHHFGNDVTFVKCSLAILFRTKSDHFGMSTQNTQIL